MSPKNISFSSINQNSFYTLTFNDLEICSNNVLQILVLFLTVLSKKNCRENSKILVLRGSFFSFCSQG
eukprot:UN09785